MTQTQEDNRSLELAHEPHIDHELFNESWYFDAAAPDGSIGVYLRTGRVTNQGKVLFSAAIVRPGKPAIVIQDQNAPLPTDDHQTIETSVFTSRQECVQPMKLFRVTLKGTGQAFADESAPLRGEPGEPVEVSFDLNWASQSEPYHWSAARRYEVSCAVSGTISIDGEEIEFSGFGERDHSVGSRDWWAWDWCWSAFHLEDGTTGHTSSVEGMEMMHGCVQVDGEHLPLSNGSSPAEHLENGLVTGAVLNIEDAGLTLTVKPLSFGALRLTSGEDKVSWFPRALARFTEADGRTGYGWIEWNKVQSGRTDMGEAIALATADAAANSSAKVTVHTKNVNAIAEGLAEWLPGALGITGDVQVSNVAVPEASGMSSVTVLFDATWQGADGEVTKRLVGRIPPEDESFPLFPTYDLALQYNVMEAIGAGTNAPVPGLIGIDETGKVIGDPFMVMEAATGDAPADNPPYTFVGDLLNAEEGQRRALQDATVRAIAEVHRTPNPEQVLGKEKVGGLEALRAHLAAAREFYDWSRSGDGLSIPILEQALDWCEANLPGDPGDPVLSWGDARIGNVLYDGFAPSALLDWEMVDVAPRGVDLGWMVFHHMFFQNIAEMMGMPGLPDFARADDVVATYAEASGVHPGDLDWYVVYAAVRFGTILSRVKRRAVHFGEEEAPEDANGYVMFADQLAGLIAD